MPRRSCAFIGSAAQFGFIKEKQPLPQAKPIYLADEKRYFPVTPA